MEDAKWQSEALHERPGDESVEVQLNLKIGTENLSKGSEIRLRYSHLKILHTDSLNYLRVISYQHKYKIRLPT